MKIVGCDLHTRYQQIAMLDEETGELVERRLEHESGEARAFYASSQGRCEWASKPPGTRAGSSGCWRSWGTSCGSGMRPQIRASMVRKQKTDERDAAHVLQLLLSERFPRIWRPSLEERDLRQLVWHRQKLVWMRNAVGNQLHALAMGEGVCRKKKLFTKQGRAELESSAVGSVGQPSPARIADDARSTGSIAEELDQAVAEQAEQNAGSGASDDPSRSGSGYLAGLRADAGAGGAIRAQQAGGQLSGAESARALFRRTAAAGSHLQARQSHDAVVTGGSRTHGGAAAMPSYTRLSAPEVAPGQWRGQGRHRPETGGDGCTGCCAAQASYAQLVRMQGSPGATLVKS